MQPLNIREAVDLDLELDGGEVWAIEIKRSSAPKVSRGFHIACEDVRPDRRLVVHGGDESYPLRDGVEAVGLGGYAGSWRRDGHSTRATSDTVVRWSRAVGTDIT